MKQVFLDGSGRISIAEVPPPEPRAGCVLVRNAFSLVSRGTETRAIAAAGEGLMTKLRRNPGLLVEAAGTVLREGPRGLASKMQETRGKREPLGYSCAGWVLSCGDGVTHVSPGDRVACGGFGYASHAEVVRVPQNLVARAPPGLDLTEAAFATLGSIALHALRQGRVQIGDRALVIGLGLVGQLMVQLLRAAGGSPFGIARKPEAVERVRTAGGEGATIGSEDLAEAVARWSGGSGADAAFVCTSGGGAEVLSLAEDLVRRRGRVVIVGSVDLDFRGTDLFRKEVEVVSARGYGPGRYDPAYEEGGLDYPLPHVRWTAQRNLALFLDLLARGRIEIKSLISAQFPVEQAPEAYRALGQPGTIGVLLRYGQG